MEDNISITVIATGFEQEPPLSTIGVSNNVNTIVTKAWEKKINSVPTSTESTSSNSNDLDIPSFLRKNKNH